MSLTNEYLICTQSKSMVGVPDGQAIPVQVAGLAMHFEMDMEFPVMGLAWLFCGENSQVTTLV